MADDDPREIPGALAARETECWDRLDDAVIELYAAHCVSLEAITDRVNEAVEEVRAVGAAHAQVS